MAGADDTAAGGSRPESVREIRIGPQGLPGTLSVPEGARAVVAFAHGSGSSRHSPRNRRVAAALREAGLATLLFDLLTPAEEVDRRNVFDIRLLAGRLVEAVEWLRAGPETGALPVGLFGASTGAAAALVAAADPRAGVGAVVSRGGRPDLAGEALKAVTAPTLLIVGSLDGPVIDMNREAEARLSGERRLVLVEGAGHLFEEPGTLGRVIDLAADWFRAHL